MNITINSTKSKNILEIYTNEMKIKNNNDDDIKYIKQYLIDKLNEYELVWCGSRRKNTAIGDSDLDLLVIKKNDIYRGEIKNFMHKIKTIKTNDLYKPNILCNNIIASIDNTNNDIKIINNNEYILLKYKKINVEILPAKYFINRKDIFIIPKTNNNWKIGFSRVDESKINKMNNKINDGYFKKIIKILKTIKNEKNNNKFPSFFIEYMIYHYFKNKLENNINYNIELYDVCEDIISFINNAIINKETYYHLSNYNINILDCINKNQKKYIVTYIKWINDIKE